MIVRIKRQCSPETAPYWQEFQYTGSRNVSVAHVLDVLNDTDDLTDIHGDTVRRIRWECSCMQKICGACAMIICGKPALACDTFLSELKTEELVLEPLSKFPVISDLIVDRSIIQQNLVQAGMYEIPGTSAAPNLQEHRYQISKCLKCGLCLEVCPNYHRGEQFYGAILANDAFLLYSRKGERKQEIRKAYRKHFENGCSTSLACMEICPMKMETLSSIARMNRG